MMMIIITRYPASEDRLIVRPLLSRVCALRLQPAEPQPYIDGSSAAAKVTSGATRRPGAVGKSGRRCGGGPTVPHHLSPREGKGRRLSVFEHGHAASLELPLAPAPGVPSLWSNRPFDEHRRSLEACT